MTGKPVAVLTSTVIPKDGLYSVASYHRGAAERGEIVCKGVKHYVGHPSTAKVVESMGAIASADKLFPGLMVGESALVATLRPEHSYREKHGHSGPHVNVTAGDLRWRILRRVE